MCGKWPSLCLLCAGICLNASDSESGELCPACAGKANSMREEGEIRAHLSWTPSPNWTLELAVSYERPEGAAEEYPQCFSGSCASYNPTVRADTIQVPLVARYSSSSGLFAQFNAAFIRKEAEFSPLSLIKNISDSVVLLDAGVGFRLPRRQGILSLEVFNVLDEEYRFDDEETKNEKKLLLHLVPDRAIAIRFSLEF